MPSRSPAFYSPASATSRVFYSPLLSNIFVPDLSAAGFVVGTLTLNRTPVGVVTFLEVSDPDSKFTVVGNELRLSASVNHAVATSHLVTLRATDNGVNYDQQYRIVIRLPLPRSAILLEDGSILSLEDNSALALE